MRNERGGVGIGILVAIGVLVLGLGLTWIAQGNDFFLTKVFSPRQEAVRRQVFEQSKAYNQGMIQELENMQFEFCRTDPSHQQALASIVLHRAADFNLEQDQVPQSLRVFVSTLRNNDYKGAC